MSSNIRPIRPAEAAKKSMIDFPDAVFESFNHLISLHFYGNSATVKQDDVVKLMVEKGLNRNDIFDKHWLDIEGQYGAAGWKVVYDKPGYNESGSAYFVFTRKNRI
ncbi:MAG: hypothetical protein HGA31_02060 [Candidatus Moranbacteria bacterium]|nr:hypothetical protein [Candidatus Moranbacteria bacterium]